MFCPQCGQERISDATSFCSRCGYLLTGTAELMKTGGARPQTTAGVRSPRSHGLRQGLFMFLLMFVVAPIVGLISTFALGIDPWPVGIVVLLLGLGGILRMVYALMFESKEPAAIAFGARELDTAELSTSALPPQRDIPASAYVSPTRREHVTSTPDSVTEDTTRLLQKEDEG